MSSTRIARTVATAALVVVAACQGSKKSAGPPSPAEVERGKGAIGTLKKTLVGALTHAMGKGVPAAIEVCNTEAPALTAKLSTDGITVGRATRKPRNPANAATGWQADALTHFEAVAAAGKPLQGVTFARRLPDGRTAYAEPLVIQELCLACHGEQLAPEVAAAIGARYPQDQATGYKLGELRGVAWAEIAPGKP